MVEWLKVKALSSSPGTAKKTKTNKQTNKKKQERKKRKSKKEIPSLKDHLLALNNDCGDFG
jgi:hypothetical protein